MPAVLPPEDELPYVRPNIWDRAGALPIRRFDRVSDRLEPMEPGVKYFLLQLERHGAITSWSCEGHPNGFYLVFTGPEALARRIVRLGWFNVELEEPEATYSLRRSTPATVRERPYLLRLAAIAWERGLGRLNLRAVQLEGFALAWPATRN